jgi:ribulose kinase
MWMDVRASDQAVRIQETGDPALKYSGFGAVSAEWGLPKALWLKESEPMTWAAAKHICDAPDWVINRLTGEWSGSINVAAPKYFYDRDKGGFPETLLASVRLEDFLEKYPEHVRDMGVVGDCGRRLPRSWGSSPTRRWRREGLTASWGRSGWGWWSPASWRSSRALPMP